MSRSSLREAVRVLQQMRVLDVRHGSGTYVSSLEPAQLLEGIAVRGEGRWPRGPDQLLPAPVRVPI
ncbi:GntR family transcriptional regulator [Streptomyces sp. NBC_00090]